MRGRAATLSSSMLTLVVGLAAGYGARSWIAAQSEIVTLQRDLELGAGPRTSCILPKGTVLAYEDTLGSEGVSRYILYVNVKAGVLPESVPARAGFRAPLNGFER